MCIAVPMKLARVDGTNAWDDRGEHVDLSLVGSQAVGSWVLNFLGAARSVIDENEATKISKALAALDAVRSGGDIGDAFDDIVGSEPQLPPHLAAALAEGKTTS